MNIAFDSVAILGPMSKNRGIGNYALSQFKTMLEMDKDNKYFFINIFDKDFSFANFGINYSNLKEFHLWLGKDMFLSENPDYVNIYAGIIKNFIKNNEIDVFYITSPFENTVFPYEREWFGDVNVIATVYDIIPYVMKDIYLANSNTRKWYMRCLEAIKHFDKYLVISNSVKKDLIKHLEISEHKIDVMNGAASDFFKKIDISECDKDALYRKFNIKDKFIMCTGGDDYRKNLQGLIEAYSKLSYSLIEEYQLVVVCKLSLESVKKYTDIIDKCEINGRVILTNFVNDDDLLKLYNLASLMAFPSKYEGFGLPVVESFACGLPVLTSNNSSLGEIAEGAAVLVDPFSVNDISRGLEYAILEADIEQNILNGYEKLQKYQWKNVAKVALHAINSFKEIKKENSTPNGKLAMFTPLPPQESGIADYSFDIINALSNYVDIDVFIDDGYEPDCQFNDRVKVYNHKQYRKNASIYFDTLYQVGNSVFHTYMYHYIRKYSGTVILHDYNLHSVVYTYCMDINYDNKLYNQYLLEDLTEAEAKIYFENIHTSPIHQKITEVELNGFITNYAKKIIVHSDYAKEKLLLKDIGRSIRTIRHYAKIEPTIDSQKLKTKHDYDKNDIVFASFGHVHETKRALPILKAFIKLSDMYPQARYVFVGKLAPNIKDSFNAFVKENNLQSKVKVTDYVDLEEFKEYIDLADICLNLRHPYNGETSGSLMRILAKGKCVIVNDIGSFGEIPDDCCVKLPNVASLTECEEIDLIYDAIYRLMSSEEKRKNLSTNAKTYAENNLDLSFIVESYYDFIVKEPSNLLSEQIIENIINHELLQKKYSKVEIKELSSTLAFSSFNCG